MAVKLPASEVRRAHPYAVLWFGLRTTSKTQGIHAVGELTVKGFEAGSRKAACGLIGRFLVDPPHTGPANFMDTDFDERCTGCAAATTL